MLVVVLGTAAAFWFLSFSVANWPASGQPQGKEIRPEVRITCSTGFGLL